MMPIESERGCGYRIVGKLYLVGSGLSRVCDGLPYLLKPCLWCGYTPKFSRNFQWVNKKYFLPHDDGCDCPSSCPICHPENNDRNAYGLMWVGSRYYTPESFILEAERMGVSKAIPNIPKDLVFGESLILLAHSDVYEYDPIDEDNIIYYDIDEKYSGVFYAFVPQRVEMLIWESDATDERLAELEGRGITPIIVPDGDVAHAP